jgi:hypothetical protein
LPLGLPYSERHTFPLVAKAVMPQVVGKQAAGQAVACAWDFRATRDPSLVGIVEKQLAEEALEFVPLAKVSEQDGRYWDAAAQRPVRICSIKSLGSNERGLLRFRVECHSDPSKLVRYEVELRATPQSTSWSVGKPKLLK